MHKLAAIASSRGSSLAGCPGKTSTEMGGLTMRKATRGPAGPRGKRGEIGPTGPTGPKASRADILAMVEDQFVEIRKEMSLQLSRMAQIQVQLDQIQTMLKKLVR
jgi:hypothetical protein